MRVLLVQRLRGPYLVPLRFCWDMPDSSTRIGCCCRCSCPISMKNSLFIYFFPENVDLRKPTFAMQDPRCDIAECHSCLLILVWLRFRALTSGSQPWHRISGSGLGSRALSSHLGLWHRISNSAIGSRTLASDLGCRPPTLGAFPTPNAMATLLPHPMSC